MSESILKKSMKAWRKKMTKFLLSIALTNQLTIKHLKFDQCVAETKRLFFTLEDDKKKTEQEQREHCLLMADLLND